MSGSHFWRLSYIPGIVKLWESPRQSRGLTQYSYEIRTTSTDEDKLSLKKELSKFNVLYIIDAGEGMTQQVIKKHWMTIGTDNKAVDIFTKNGRVKAGAKGIGRFALDKLGDRTEMTTIFDNNAVDKDDNGEVTNNCGYNWKVDWSDFEGEFKTIDSVNAELMAFKDIAYKNELPNTNSIRKLVEKYNFTHGTMLKITNLRQNWDDFNVNQIYTDLEVLVPPKENKQFDIFLFSSLEENKYGEITGSICDDYDYKLIAKADKNQNINITIHRNEYDLNVIPPDFFNRNNFKQSPYLKENFKIGKWTTTKTFSQLLPGFKDVDDENVFNDVGVFEFAFYFMKKTYTTSDKEKFFFRRFKSNERKDWLGKFGGIKLFRDNFRVRPYGEVKDTAFDWLALGARKAQSPAGSGKKGGGYKVNPENVAGAINISRLTNVDFEDKSSREGLQENKTFLIFKKLIAGIISVFENDIAYIAREMSEYYDELYSDVKDKEEAEKIAKKILATNKQKQDETTKQGQDETTEQDASDNELILAKLNKEKSEEIEKLKDEQKILRGLASAGIVMASFTHELSNLDDVLNSRIDDLIDMITIKVDENIFSGEDDYLNPFVMLSQMRNQDSKIQNWLRFSIGTAKKDKRTRKKLSLKSYFEKFKTTWEIVLNDRGIQFTSKIINDVEMRIFEIDLDSIFNNLLVNSIDAFLRSKKAINRNISVSISESSKELIIDYYDNGPSLSKDITNPQDIFKALFTTKRNQYTGEEEGTGLGMWLIKTIAEDNDAIVKILFPDEGFGIRFIFPIKYKRQNYV